MALLSSEINLYLFFYSFICCSRFAIELSCIKINWHFNKKNIFFFNLDGINRKMRSFNFNYFQILIVTHIACNVLQKSHVNNNFHWINWPPAIDNLSILMPNTWIRHRIKMKSCQSTVKKVERIWMRLLFPGSPLHNMVTELNVTTTRAAFKIILLQNEMQPDQLTI